MSSLSAISIVPSRVQLDQEVLQLDPDLELIPLRSRLREHVAEDRARAVRPSLALDRDIAREPRQVRLPRHEREALQIGDRRDIRVARELADLSRREPREPGAVLDEPVELLRRHELRARTPVHVHELGEDELDPTIGDRLPNRVEPRDVRCHRTSSVVRSEWVLSSAPRADDGQSLHCGAGELWGPRLPSGEREPELNELHGDLDHQPIVPPEVDAGEVGDAPKPLAQRVRVDEQRIGRRTDAPPTVQKGLEGEQERRSSLAVVVCEPADSVDRGIAHAAIGCNPQKVLVRPEILERHDRRLASENDRAEEGLTCLLEALGETRSSCAHARQPDGERA